jgi:predicted ATP-grasp superfamily ATP-dependent carboligase
MPPSIQRAPGATVVIGFAESLSAPEVLWSLVDQGVSVVAFTRKGSRPALRHSRHVRLFEITPPDLDLAQSSADLKREIEGLVATHGQVVLVPLDDEAVWLCGRTNFGGQVVVAGPRGDGVDIALDKRKQLELARTSGFNVPPARYMERVEEVNVAEVRYPAVFKPAAATSQRGAGLAKGRGWICSDRAELEGALKSWNGGTPMLLQQFVPGVGEGLFGLATDRGVIAWSGHRRLRMMNPHGSGASACITAPAADSASRSAAEKFLTACGWRGLFMIEQLRDDAGKLWFIEFNGRCWGSMALARRAGLEYPAWAVEMARDPDVAINVPPAKENAIICRHLGRELLHLMFVLRGSKSKALIEWPSFGGSLRQVCRWGRNEHWYNWREDDKKVFFADVYGTVRDQLFKPKT